MFRLRVTKSSFDWRSGPLPEFPGVYKRRGRDLEGVRTDLCSQLGFALLRDNAGLDEAGNVQMKINLFESADLQTFAPFTVTPESVSVVDGSICLEFARADDAAFFRFSVR